MLAACEERAKSAKPFLSPLSQWRQEREREREREGVFVFCTRRELRIVDRLCRLLRRAAPHVVCFHHCGQGRGSRSHFIRRDYCRHHSPASPLTAWVWAGEARATSRACALAISASCSRRCALLRPRRSASSSPACGNTKGAGRKPPGAWHAWRARRRCISPCCCASWMRCRSSSPMPRFTFWMRPNLSAMAASALRKRARRSCTARAARRRRSATSMSRDASLARATARPRLSAMVTRRFFRCCSARSMSRDASLARATARSRLLRMGPVG
mmetsp:Transcript_42636/g.133659  ORF Transcript_42636/g.133659 Transcript_42636/m.133659 type:complete len:272 (+) Transcript_42636:663-1478(+)